MKSSKAVRIGAMVGLFVASLACADGEETEIIQTQYGEICVRREEPPPVDMPFMQDEPTMERVPWEQCKNDPSHIHHYPYYINHGAGHPAPPVGSRFAPSHGTATRPAAGSFAAAPPSGGFGTKTSVVGG